MDVLWRFDISDQIVLSNSNIVDVGNWGFGFGFLCFECWVVEVVFCISDLVFWLSDLRFGFWMLSFEVLSPKTSGKLKIAAFQRANSKLVGMGGLSPHPIWVHSTQIPFNLNRSGPNSNEV